jgi:hypothetical protein
MALQTGMWFQIELPEPIMLVEVQFDSPVSGSPPPAATSLRGCQVQVSIDGQSWSEPLARDQGTGVATVLTFAPARARFIRLTQTAAVDSAPAWSIQRLRLFQAPASMADAR